MLCWKLRKAWRLIAAFAARLRKWNVRHPAVRVCDESFLGPCRENYLGRFERAFDGKFKDTAGGATAYPHNFFNDSYEVYGAGLVGRTFDEFLASRL